MSYLKLKDESGVALLLALVVTVIGTVLASSYMTVVIHETRLSVRQQRRAEAFYLAEAGIARAKNTLKDSDFTEVLLGADGQPGTEDDGVLDFGPSVSFGSGTYEVKVTDNDDSDVDVYADVDRCVAITSVGNSGDLSRTIRVFLAPSFSLDKAIATGGDLRISGNPKILGDCGSVHANSDLWISGNPTINRDATAHHRFIDSGNPTIRGRAAGGQPEIDIPVVDPEDYRDRADYILESNGFALDSSGAPIAFEEFNGWKWGGDSWKLSNDKDIQDGTYYIEGNAIVSGNPGRGDPWSVTIIAEGSVVISGNPRLEADQLDILFVAGGDLKISGNPDQSYKGYMLVHEQIELSSNSSLNGAILAEDAEDNYGTVSQNRVSGNITITYDGDLSPILNASSFEILSWEEVL